MRRDVQRRKAPGLCLVCKWREGALCNHDAHLAQDPKSKRWEPYFCAYQVQNVNQCGCNYRRFEREPAAKV